MFAYLKNMDIPAYTHSSVELNENANPMNLPKYDPIYETNSILARYFYFQKRYVLEDDLSSASCHFYYVVKGKGMTQIGKSNVITIAWKEGDVIALPYMKVFVLHTAFVDTTLFSCDDSLYLEKLCVAPISPLFKPIHFIKEIIAQESEKDCVFLRSEKTKDNDLSPSLSAQIIFIKPYIVKKPSLTNDSTTIIIQCIDENAYTLISSNIDEGGSLIEPVKMDWKKGSNFVIPPHWWYVHGNDTKKTRSAFVVKHCSSQN